MILTLLRRGKSQHCEYGETKFWIEPVIELARNYVLTQPDFKRAHWMIGEHEYDIPSAVRGNEILDANRSGPV